MKRDEEVAQYLLLRETKESLIRNSTLTTNWTIVVFLMLWHMMEVMCCGTCWKSCAVVHDGSDVLWHMMEVMCCGTRWKSYTVVHYGSDVLWYMMEVMCCGTR
jgi:hypothetical protein